MRHICVFSKGEENETYEIVVIKLSHLLSLKHILY